MTVENDLSGGANGIPIFENPDALLDLNLFYIRQIGASLRKHVGIQDKLEREIKLRDGASRMLAACTHEDQLLEVAKTLHTSNARMYTYMAELQKLKTAEIMDKAMDDEGCHTESKICSGRVAISDIRIPLMWSDAEKFSGAKVKDASRYAVFCLIRVGGEVQDTELVCMDKTTTDLIFRDVLVFEDASHNFRMDIEVHAFPMSGEPISAPTPQKLFSRLNRSIGKSEGKRIRDRLKESPATNMKLGPQYEKLGSLTLDLSCVDDHIRSHDITKVILPTSPSMRSKPLLPLYGNLTCRLVAQPRCITEKCIAGFLHYMEVGNGLPCWAYMWCEVKAGKMRCWLNPEDTPTKTPQCTIDLMATDIKINEIEKNRQKRPNSFQIRDFENRRMFSASTKDDLSRWIKNLRQHRSDCTAWSTAYLPEKNGAQPMFIASPSPFDSPSQLLFDSSAKKALVYEQLSMESPTKSDNEAISIGDLVKKTPSTSQPSTVHDTVDSYPSTPWAGLFNGALNKSASKVTKLKDVQNIMGTEASKKSTRLRTKSFDGILSSVRSSRHKKDDVKPPVPGRPSEEKIREIQKMRSKSPVSAISVAKIEDLKNCSKSESYTETCLSDVGLSSDDVFLSSDDNVLNSPAKIKMSAGKKKGKKKRKAPLPPLPDQSSSQKTISHLVGNIRSSSQTSFSSASSLDDVLDRKSEPRKPPRPGVPPAHISSKASIGGSIDCDDRKSQLSLSSNSTQFSNTSSGYKSDSEGLANIPKSPCIDMNTPSREQHHYEVVVFDHNVNARKEKTRIRVLPPDLPCAKKPTPVKLTRSHSWDSDVLLDDKRLESDTAKNDPRMRSDSTPSQKSRSNGKYSNNRKAALLLSSSCQSPIDPIPSFQRPTPAPRRSYLTAVESTKVKSPISHLYDEPPDPPNLNEDPTYDEIQDIYSVPIAKSLRPAKKVAPNDDNEPIYAQVDKSRKTKSVPKAVITADDYTKAQKAIITVCRQKMNEVAGDSDDEAVYV